jgi:hypothetical protein
MEEGTDEESLMRSLTSTKSDSLGSEADGQIVLAKRFDIKK